ncbi:PepSY domain-containing protein [Streptomyces sp. YS415]|uniref:PepSY domain-containing protein n=1 Tax=Streptomyces sp. YS415 TaxID=2944806 RepID=UPI002021893A|nr:PepSY domain-containing protein [Streptomyces sp. YS415]MCL7427420.1 PepSY domain-containing protein [Streptomyces sp. YS415]
MKRNIVIATVTAAALVTGGTVAAYASGDDSAPAQRDSNTRVADDRDDDRDDSRDDSQDGTRDDDTAEARTAEVTAADAVTAALKRTPGTAVSVDREDDGEDAWEVDVVTSDGTEYTVRIAAGSGEVLGADRDDDDSDGRDDLAALKGTTVDAREAARAGAAKGTVTEVDLDDDGPAVWTVETTKGEWKVDPRTAELSRSQDDDRQADDD